MNDDSESPYGELDQDTAPAPVSPHPLEQIVWQIDYSVEEEKHNPLFHQGDDSGGKTNGKVGIGSLLHG